MMIEAIQTEENALTTSIITSNREATAVISHHIRPGYESRYETWLKKISHLAKYFPGHNGVTILRPDTGLEYTILLRFDTYNNLYQWIKSPVIKEWLFLAIPLIETSKDLQILTGLKTLVASPEPSELNTSSTPPRYKTSIVTWIGVYICASGLGIVLTPVLAGLPYLVGQAIATVLVVIVLDYVMMPRLMQYFQGWLNP